ncbi:Uncharacterised protein [Chromobacterium violaceum]|uniref:Uncharacterized protein n=1 Tax=Chromobacterium violaceum TaxID=536 RepID=A0A447T440_CHRVL|nr:Uncharacterised protein [Chromobacterium violaceum]
MHANVDWQTINRYESAAGILSDNKDAERRKLCQNQPLCMADLRPMHGACSRRDGSGRDNVYQHTWRRRFAQSS